MACLGVVFVMVQIFHDVWMVRQVLEVRYFSFQVALDGCCLVISKNGHRPNEP